MAGPPDRMRLESTILEVINAGGAIAWSGDSMRIDSGEHALTLVAEPPASDDPVVDGVVAYRERIAMPPGAVLTVQLLDVSRADAAADVIAGLTDPDPGNVPIRFELPYDASVIDDRGSYAVRARLDVDGELWWTTTDAHLVITGGHPSTVDIVLRRVSR
jgi:putative lipoprotein